jgi:CRP/FNR family transcriptional regulator, cyclic AMP receptor protein
MALTLPFRVQTVRNCTRNQSETFEAGAVRALNHYEVPPIPSSESVLSGLPTELSHGLFAKALTLSLAADQTLFMAGDEGNGCYRVDAGLLKATVAEPGGDERILAMLGPGSVVGELSMIDREPRSASVVAVCDSELSFISRAAFEAFGQSRPELYRYLTTLLAHRLRFTNDTVAATSFLSFKGKVARALLSLAEEFGRDAGKGRIVIQQKVSQGDLAAMAGTARETVSRVLHDWTDRSLVSRIAGHYYLEDKTLFKKEAEDYVPSRHRTPDGVRQMRNDRGSRSVGSLAAHR